MGRLHSDSFSFSCAFDAVSNHNGIANSGVSHLHCKDRGHG
jgi:hypothetical protein